MYIASQMKKEIKYKVAGHVFSMLVPESDSVGKLLTSYQPFRLEDGDPSEPLFTLEVSVGELPETGELLQLCNDEAPYLWIYKCADGSEATDALCFGFSFDKDEPKGIVTFKDSEDWSHGHITIAAGCRFSVADSAINNAMMLMYAYNTGWHDTLMLHASAPMKDGLGYMFMAKSGTGKSTHSQMWLDNIEGTELLNDDNPVVRVIDGKVMLFGSPWSGKTPCYKNRCVPLAGAIRIIRAPYNKATRLNLFGAYASLLPSCSSMKWNEKWNEAQNKTIEKVISTVPCWNMECLPNADAAKVCYEAVSAAYKK